MKKVLSILLIVVMMLSVLVIPAYASADIYKDIPKTDYKYYSKARDYIGHQYAPETPYNNYYYRELCYYSDENQEEADWVLMVCRVMPMGFGYKYGALIGNRAVFTHDGSGYIKFYTGLAVYIPETGEFIELNNDNMEQIIEKCPNFVETIEEKEIGQMIGDVNEDDVIDIIDATYIQREIAGIPYNYYVLVDSGKKDFYISDFDRDGEQTILDATAIQRHIAGLE